MAVRRLHAPPRTKPMLVLRTSGTLSGLGSGGTSPPPTPSQPPTFNGNVANLYEDVGDGPTELSKAGFSSEGGKSQRVWQLNPADADDLVGSITGVLGATQYRASGTGKLVRTLPLADPFWDWMYASSIPTVEGYGTAARTASDEQLEAPAFPYGALWDYYRLSVESQPRPFPVLPDSQINVVSGSWYPENGGGTTEVPFQYALEQNRYCTWEFQQQSDYITMQRGAMVFNSSAFSSPMGLQAMPRVYLPNMELVVTWYQVPLRFAISGNSYLQRWLGRINQNPVKGPDDISFPPGSLLYLSYTTKTFTPPVQGIVPLGGGGGNVVSTDKLINVVMRFLYTPRSISGTVATPPTNRNFVTAGHNLLPWNSGLFFYAQTATITTGPYIPPIQNMPSWLSAPLEVLWTDPDSNIPSP